MTGTTSIANTTTTESDKVGAYGAAGTSRNAYGDCEFEYSYVSLAGSTWALAAKVNTPGTQDQSWPVYNGVQANVIPQVFLKTNLVITGGTGSVDDPYILG